MTGVDMRGFLSMIVAFTAIAGGAMASPPGAGQSASQLGRGINVIGYDPMWKDPAKARFKPGYYQMLRDSGFDHIRVNLEAFAHMDAADRLAPQWLATLDDVVQRATRAGLMVILDEHDFRFCGQDADACRTKLLAFWSQIAPRYADAPPTVLFEILNEPNRAITPELWNGLLAETLALIRQTNPTRDVVIGPANSNNFRSLDELSLPQGDRHIVVTVHYYDPFPFTHQGAKWTNPSRENMVGVAWGSAAEHQTITRDFAAIASWSREHDRPILLGEFGAYDRGDMAARVAWTSTVARTAEQNHFAWSYWQFDGNFIAYDVAHDTWVAPIYSALVPDPPKPVR